MKLALEYRVIVLPVFPRSNVTTCNLFSRLLKHCTFALYETRDTQTSQYCTQRHKLCKRSWGSGCNLKFEPESSFCIALK